MRILVISDLHANLTALEAVIAAAGEFDATWCLGDLVGYGPDPNECTARLRQLPNLKCVVGNHDAAVLMQIDSDTFNPEARSAIFWTRKTISDEVRKFLEVLPERIVIEELGVTLVHGSPRHPVWEYLLDVHTATANFNYFETPWCFVGHTHLPAVFPLLKDSYSASLQIPVPGQAIPLPNRAIINPGSVGQPRDHDPRASFAIFDSELYTWTNQRIAYDIPGVQTRMEQFRLPERHILRLSGGW
jgi:predicted phosphodiesterase